jgi:hypothetical protein
MASSASFLHAGFLCSLSKYRAVPPMSRVTNERPVSDLPGGKSAMDWREAAARRIGLGATLCCRHLCQCDFLANRSAGFQFGPDMASNEGVDQ